MRFRVEISGGYLPGDGMQLEQIKTGIYKTRVADRDILLFMSDKLKRGNYYHEAVSDAIRMSSEYAVTGEIVLLPDMTPASSLPIGTAVAVGPGIPINPNLIGIDIGCGYTLFSADKSARRLVKNGKANSSRIERIVQAVSDATTGYRKNMKIPGVSGIPIPKADVISEKYLGTVGGGNHFVDLFVIDQIHDEAAARRHKIDDGKIYFLIHTGSRMLGLETNKYFADLYDKRISNFNQQYLGAVRSVVNYASANRKQIRANVMDALSKDSIAEVSSEVLLNAPHNDIEVDCDEGKAPKRYIIRKGCSRLRPGELAVIPGTCNSPAYLVQGAAGLAASHFSINHGVGRTKTRGQTFSRYARDKNLSRYFKGVVLNVDPKKMVEEVPAAYKKIEDIVDSIEQANLATRVARLRPLGVVVERKNEGR